jgi:hypothetical protein
MKTKHIVSKKSLSIHSGRARTSDLGATIDVTHRPGDSVPSVTINEQVMTAPDLREAAALFCKMAYVLEQKASGEASTF